MKKMTRMIMTLTALAGVLVGCAATQEVPKAPETLPVLRIGVMSAADSAPILLAEKEGYFDEAGVDVALEVFTNGATKQSSIQAGELEGAMVSMIQYLNNKANGLDARMTTTTDGVFPIVLSPKYEEKKDVKVGLMEVSVTNYLADQYLKDYNVEKVFINEMPVRMQMLMAGEIDMAVLPEPMASTAQLKGLEKRVYGNPDDFTPNAMIFTNQVIEEQTEAVAAFHNAYNRAVEEIQSNPQIGIDILVSELELDPQVADLIQLPTYHETRVPDEAFVESVATWTEALQGTTFDLKYEDLITEAFVK